MVENFRISPRAMEQVSAAAAFLGYSDRIELVAGRAEETIPEYVEQHPELTISLLHLDFDLYQPTAVALDCLFDRVARGGIIIADQYGQTACGETEAINERLETTGGFGRVSWMPGLMSYVVKP